MDFSKGRNIKSLSDSEYNVWSNLNPELDPAQWAALICRKIGKMSLDEFNGLISLFGTRNAVTFTNSVSYHLKV